MKILHIPTGQICMYIISSGSCTSGAIMLLDGGFNGLASKNPCCSTEITKEQFNFLWDKTKRVNIWLYNNRMPIEYPKNKHIRDEFELIT